MRAAMLRDSRTAEGSGRRRYSMSNPDRVAKHKNVQAQQGKINSLLLALRQEPEPPRLFSLPRLRRTSSWRAYAQALIVVALSTLLAWLMFPYFAQSSLIMVYLVGVVITAARCGRGPSIMASILSVAALDFFFVVPYFTFVVADSQTIVTFAVMLLVAITISTLTARIKQQAEAAREREQRTISLYALSRELANTPGTENLVSIATKHISELLRSPVAAFLPGSDGLLQARTGSIPDLNEREKSAARWVFAHGQVAGAGTETFCDVRGLYLPLVGSECPLAVLGFFFSQPAPSLSPPHLHYPQTFLSRPPL